MANLIHATVSGFPEYHKIETLFERKEDFSVDAAKLKKSVLGTIREWDVTEKIDGTNIRVMISESGVVSFGGRTDNSQFPSDLFQYLVLTFPADLLKAVFWIDGEPTSAVLYGEGYGAGIQKGGCYRPDKAFILFDVLVAGQWWMDREALMQIAADLDIELVPYLGRQTLDQIVEGVRLPFASRIGTGMAEGIVARPIETLFDKRRERIIIKLKTRDFQAGKR